MLFHGARTCSQHVAAKRRNCKRPSAVAKLGSGAVIAGVGICVGSGAVVDVLVGSSDMEAVSTITV